MPGEVLEMVPDQLSTRQVGGQTASLSCLERTEIVLPRGQTAIMERGDSAHHGDSPRGKKSPPSMTISSFAERPYNPDTKTVGGDESWVAFTKGEVSWSASSLGVRDTASGEEPEREVSVQSLDHQRHPIRIPENGTDGSLTVAYMDHAMSEWAHLKIFDREGDEIDLRVPVVRISGSGPLILAPGHT